MLKSKKYKDFGLQGRRYNLGVRRYTEARRLQCDTKPVASVCDYEISSVTLKQSAKFIREASSQSSRGDNRAELIVPVLLCKNVKGKKGKKSGKSGVYIFLPHDIGNTRGIRFHWWNFRKEIMEIGKRHSIQKGRFAGEYAIIYGCVYTKMLR